MVNTEIRLITHFEAKYGEALHHQHKQYRGLTVAQIMNFLLPNSDINLKKVGKTTRPFRYDLNQIPYDYTVKVTNRFKGLDLIECLKKYGKPEQSYLNGHQPRARHPGMRSQARL